MYLSGSKVPEFKKKERKKEYRDDDVSVPVSFCLNFIIIRERFKTVERKWNTNKVPNFTAGTCISHEII